MNQRRSERIPVELLAPWLALPSVEGGKGDAAERSAGLHLVQIPIPGDADVGFMALELSRSRCVALARSDERSKAESAMIAGVDKAEIDVLDSDIYYSRYREGRRRLVFPPARSSR